MEQPSQQITDVKFYQTCAISYDEKEKYRNGNPVITKIELKNPVNNKTKVKFNTFDKFTTYVQKHFEELKNSYTGKLYVDYYECLPDGTYRKCKGEIDNYGRLNGLVEIENNLATYVGYCKNGKKNGKGNLLYYNDTHIIGKWKDDELIKGRVLCTDGCNINVYKYNNDSMKFTLNDVDVSVFMQYPLNENDFDFLNKGLIRWNDNKGNTILYNVQNFWWGNVAVEGKLTIFDPDGKLLLNKENFNMSRKELSSLLQKTNVFEYLKTDQQFVTTIEEREDWFYEKEEKKYYYKIFPQTYQIRNDSLNYDIQNKSVLDNLNSNKIQRQDKEGKSSDLISKTILIKDKEGKSSDLISKTNQSREESESSDCFCGCLKQCHNNYIKEKEIPLGKIN